MIVPLNCGDSGSYPRVFMIVRLSHVLSGYEQGNSIAVPLIVLDISSMI